MTSNTETGRPSAAAPATVTPGEWTIEAADWACNAAKRLAAHLGVPELALAERLADGGLVGAIRALEDIAGQQCCCVDRCTLDEPNCDTMIARAALAALKEPT